ncbi:MAG: TetR/AcrR family transcriptional regulator [Thermodesulfobacteriota bacterium]
MKKSLTPKERIMNTAADLFYKQGYHQTGINQIIEVADVAKATFYSNFKSKEDLCVEYLREKDRIEIQVTKNLIKDIKDPYQKYIALIEGFVDWMKETNYRGCGFNNMVIEVTEPTNPIRKEAKFHNDAFRSILTDVVEDLKASSKKHSHINIKEVVDSYFIIVEGAITACQVYNDSWPMEHAVKAVKNLLKK